MSGSALLGFLIALIVVGGIAIIFFSVIEKVSPDAVLAKIAKVAIGVLALVYIIMALDGLLFGHGGAGAPGAGGIITFAIAAIVALLVLYLLNWALDFVGGEAGLGQFTALIKYIIAAVVADRPANDRW